MKRIASVFIGLLLGSLSLLAQPANDLCQDATNIGSPSLNQQLCSAGTNVGANPEFPYPFQNICAVGGGMASPADDVWFTVTIPSGANELAINLTGTLPSYNIGIYSGSCGSLSGLGCATSSTAAGINTTIRPVIQNTTYYIQVSGNGLGVEGTFNLCIRPQYNDNLCVVQSNITASPPPTNGSYNPGTVVTFCYSVTDFTQQSANWFHGISIQLGGGWQAGSLTAVSAPASCDGMGVWLYRNSITSSATGNTFGPGFFYDSSSGGPLDGNPGNNYGDNCSNNTWTFCWTVTVPTLPPSQCQTANPDLSVSVMQYGDGQTGSWSSVSCTANPAFNFSSVLECCEQPLITVFDESCPNACDGIAIAEGQGGTAPYTYAWGNSTTNDTATALCAGPINVTVTDAVGCDAVTTVIINSGASLNVVTAYTDETCVGAADGKAWVVNASPSLTYTWNTVPPQTGDTAFSLPAGTYTVSATGIAGCSATGTVTVGSGANLSITLAKEDISCNGLTDGKAWVVSGNASFTYDWNTVPPQSGDTAFNLPAGTYTVTATGPAGCSDIESITIVEPTLLSVTATADTTNCGGAGVGNAYATPAGGTGTYSYSWNTVPVQNTATATNLAPGTYTVIVTDAAGCTATTDATVISTPGFTANLGFQDVSCFGAADGKAWAVPNGGTPPFTFAWNTVPAQATDTAFNLGPGTYTVVLTDANGCTDQYGFTITQPSAIVAIPTIAPATCNGLNDGKITLAVSGGIPPYTYLWSDGNTGQNDTALLAGSYDVDITDSNGCVLTLTNLVVTEPTALSLTATPDSVSCHGGTDGGVDLLVTGGTPYYRYQWSNGRLNPYLSYLTAGNYSVTVTDRNGCQDSVSATVGQPDSITLVTTLNNVSCFEAADGAIDVVASGAAPPYQFVWSENTNNYTGTSLANLSGGSYQVTITDNRGCIDTLFFLVFEPQRLTAELTQSLDSTVCDGTILEGSILNATAGGTPPYVFNWSNGDTTQNTVSDLAYGPYELNVTDSNGCAVTVQTVLVEPIPLQVQLLTDSSGCYNDSSGSAEVLITGGVEPYNVVWAGLDSTNTTYVSHLAPGNYDVFVVDSKGCDTSYNFTITEQPAMSVTVPDTLVVTYGEDTALNALVSGVRPNDMNSLFWDPSEWLSCNDCADPILSAIRDRQYIIELNVNGCLYYDTLQLIVDHGPDPYFIPNAFTPNGDGVNDYFQIYGVGIKDVVFTIYNRWGGLVFSGQGMDAIWNGTYNGQNAQAGVYVYNVYFIYLDSSTERVTGSVTVLR